MTKKALTARRKRNYELSIRDAGNRCVVCKLDLGKSPQIVEDFLVPGKCCSEACLEQLLAEQK